MAEEFRPVLSLAIAMVGGFLVYQVLKVAYNLSPLHPLSGFPGPWLSSATYLPEFYWDVIRNGRYTWEIQAMHRKYGPIIRISPNELHCDDLRFADEVYAVGGRKRNKPKHQVNGSVLDLAEFGTVDHDFHRLRRAPVARFFSRAAVSQLQSEIKELVGKLCNKLLAQGSTSTPFDVAVAYSCFIADVISAYSFGQTFGMLDQPGWKPNFHDPLLSSLRPGLLFRFFPFLKHLAELAVVFVDYLPRETGLFIRELQINMPREIRRTKADLDAGLVANTGRSTIFAELYQSTELEDDQKNVKRLAAEAMALVGAGTETTSWTMAVITYHLVTQPRILECLTGELRDASVDPLCLPDWSKLEKLPYLHAVIQEGLRLSYGVSARTARIATQEDLHYRGEWQKRPLSLVIPRGYAISMSSAIMNHDEKTFPESHRFVPERWIPGSTFHNPDVDRGMFSFSKGSRACLGTNLAFCEMNLALAAVVLRVLPHMRLFETSEDDVRYHHDMFIPMVHPASKGVRVQVS